MTTLDNAAVDQPRLPVRRGQQPADRDARPVVQGHRVQRLLRRAGREREVEVAVPATCGSEEGREKRRTPTNI